MTHATLSPLQQAFIQDLADSPSQRAAIESQLREGFLFADVVLASNEQFITGSMTDTNDQTFPALFCTAEEAFEDQRDTREGYALDNPEQDYESTVFAVQWRNDDTLAFFNVQANGQVDTATVIGESSCDAAMGL